MESIKRLLVDLFKNPITEWLIWYIRSRVVLYENRGKYLKIGYFCSLSSSKFGKYNSFAEYVSVSNSVVENYVYVARLTRINNAKIGKFCSIGPDVKIGLGKHPTNFISTFPSFFSLGNQAQFTFADQSYFEEFQTIEIGNDVWIGANVVILDGVVIGDGVIIGAGSVVTKNVEPYSIVGGVPAKLIRKRFDDEIINGLLQFKWWDREFGWLSKNYHKFNKPESFFECLKNNTWN